MLAAGLEREAGSGDEVFDCLGDTYFRGVGFAGHSRADTDRDAADLAVDQLAFAGVDSYPNADAEMVDPLGDLERAAAGSRRPVEAGEEPVAGGVDLYAPPAVECAAHDRMMLLNEVLPRSIAETCLLVWRIAR